LTKPPRAIRTRLADVPRHYKALGFALEQFGGEEEYVAAATSTDPRELARTYAVERPFELLENYVIELAHRGLVETGAIGADESTTGREDLRSLADRGVITKTLQTRLGELHELRNQLVHEYPDVKAHRLYAAATALLPLVREFMSRYLVWLADLGFDVPRPAS
jgi:uncharacterized protein YutE (UPF0331/DUF86 family)